MMRDPTLEHPLLARFPLTRGLIRKRYERYFAMCSDKQLFRGLYPSFAEAEASAPPTKPVSYDNEASAELYLQQLRTHPHDYPAVFWLSRSFADGMRSVFDLGGTVGIKYFAFSRLFPFPDNVRWTVQDLPVVVDRGRRFALERQAPPSLAFTSRFEDGDGTDVLFASGVLQYLPETIGELLGRWKRLPRRIIVNTAAIHPVKTYITLNSVGTAYCPYRVQAHGAFVREVTQAGYVLRDTWENPAKFIRIPFEQGVDLDTYAGYCFDRA
jgi:putative methyltransferase (TIGR04325 family)